MKGSRLIKVLLMVLFLILPYSFAYGADIGELRVSLLQGDVQVNTVETSEWVPASINMPLKEGDRLWVPGGARTEIQLRDGTNVRLDEYTSLDILRIDDGSAQFYLTEGRAYLYFRDSGVDFVQMDTPVSSIRVYDRSVFRVDVREDGNTDISVYDGTVYAETGKGRTQVRKDQTLSLGRDDYAELSPLGPPDEWEHWNKARNDEVYSPRYSEKYLPEELEGYSHDLDKYGKWVYVTDYGYAWTPTVIAAGWAPYRDGRWVWIGGDYVWVSYEPWGWVPYHYGRWTFNASFGWIWVPPASRAAYWSPGYVAWVNTPSYVAWVPLAPGEIYYGYGYYGPNSVNIVNINIGKTRITHLYRNAHARHAVTIVDHDNFLRGRYRYREVKKRGNPFLTPEKVHPGRPLLKPERSTVMPSIKEIPSDKRPPRGVRDVRIDVLKNERPLVKERKRSVLRSSSPQRNLPVRRLGEGERKGFGTSRQPVKIERGGTTGTRTIIRKPVDNRGVERRTGGRAIEERRTSPAGPSGQPREIRRKSTPVVPATPRIERKSGGVTRTPVAPKKVSPAAPAERERSFQQPSTRGLAPVPVPKAPSPDIRERSSGPGKAVRER